jgi:hypothetical protein
MRGIMPVIIDQAGRRFNADETDGVSRRRNVFFEPKAPDGMESNWVPTRAGGRFEVLFCLYGPEQPLFDKTWQLPDMEEVR